MYPEYSRRFLARNPFALPNPLIEPLAGDIERSCQVLTLGPSTRPTTFSSSGDARSRGSGQDWKAASENEMAKPKPWLVHSPFDI